ncbi:MAG: acyl carrier protein [Bacteroidetes bacterium]|nr:acyl carrier protein [Bacteroidota bacterium]
MKTSKNADAQAIREKLMELIRQYVPAEINLDTINDNSDLIKDLKINSTRFVDIILDMEDKFGITIDDKTADGMRTVADAIAVVTKQKTT